MSALQPLAAMRCHMHTGSVSKPRPLQVASISLLYLIPVITILQMGGTEMLLHHLGSLLSVATALATGNGHMHTLWMLFTEFTTPFINNRCDPLLEYGMQCGL